MTDIPMRTSLAPVAAAAPTRPEQMKLWRQQAWHLHRVAVFDTNDPNTCRDPDVRQTIINEANRLYGEPMTPAKEGQR